jgi:hypothetical protein
MDFVRSMFPGGSGGPGRPVAGQMLTIATHEGHFDEAELIAGSSA